MSAPKSLSKDFDKFLAQEIWPEPKADLKEYSRQELSRGPGAFVEVAPQKTDDPEASAASS